MVRGPTSKLIDTLLTKPIIFITALIAISLWWFLWNRDQSSNKSQINHSKICQKIFLKICPKICPKNLSKVYPKIFKNRSKILSNKKCKTAQLIFRKNNWLVVVLAKVLGQFDFQVCSYKNVLLPLSLHSAIACIFCYLELLLKLAVNLGFLTIPLVHMTFYWFGIRLRTNDIFYNYKNTIPHRIYWNLKYKGDQTF